MSAVSAPQSTQTCATQSTQGVSGAQIDRNSYEYQAAQANVVLEAQRSGMLEAIAQLLGEGKISKAQYDKLRDEINQFIDSSLLGGVSPEYKQAAQDDMGTDALAIQKMVQEAVVKDIVENGGLLSNEMKAKLKARKNGTSGAGGGQHGQAAAGAGAHGGAGGAGGPEGAGHASGGAGGTEGAHGTSGAQGSNGVSRSEGASASGSSDGPSGGWLTLLAEVFGKILGKYAEKMTRFAQELEGLNAKAAALDNRKAALGEGAKDPQLDADIQAVARWTMETTMKLQGLTQAFNMLQTAFTTVENTAGQSMASILQKR